MRARRIAAPRGARGASRGLQARAVGRDPAVGYGCAVLLRYAHPGRALYYLPRGARPRGDHLRARLARAEAGGRTLRPRAGGRPGFGSLAACEVRDRHPRRGHLRHRLRARRGEPARPCDLRLAGGGTRGLMSASDPGRENMLDGENVVLAYSGGLDTSVCLKWLEERGAKPYALYLDLGQGEPAGDVRSKALEIGASDAFVRDARAEFAEEYVAPAIKANALYGGRYPLFTALARPLIAKKLVEAAREVGATHIAHGSTGKGNDQVRFDVTTASIAPDLTVVAPVRDWNMNRPEEIEYAREHGIPVPVTRESPYSVDANLWGRSIEAGPLEDPDHEPTEDVFELTTAPEEAPDEPRYVEIGFQEGLPVSLDGEELALVELIAQLNRVAGEHGVGRIDMIEDRLVGIKSREVYEAPAALAIIQSHRELETLTLTKDVLRFKSSVEQRYAELTYDGLWFTPLKTALDAFIEETQKTVTGTVRLKLFKGSSPVAGRTAPQALYNKDLATYDPNSTFDEASAAGFIALWGLPARQWAGVNGGIEDPSSIESKLQG